MGRAVTRIQPSLASPFVHLSGTTAQQDLADAINEREATPVFSSHHENQALEGEEGRRGGARRHMHREDARERLHRMALDCRQFVVLKWVIEIACEGPHTAVLFGVVSCAVLWVLGHWRDDRGQCVASWFNSIVAVKLARAVAAMAVVQRSLLLGPLAALVLGVAAVTWSNRQCSFFYHYLIIFFEMAVMVQSGNFSCVAG